MAASHPTRTQIQTEVGTYLTDCLLKLRTESVSGVSMTEYAPHQYQIKVWPRRGMPEYFDLTLKPWQREGYPVP